jgi:hypothetical protein
LKNKSFPALRTTASLPLQPFWDVFRLAQTGFELYVSAVTTIALRQQLWLSMPPWDPRLAIEWHRMVGEKVMAGFEVGLVLQRSAVDFYTGTAINPWVDSRKAIMPLQRRTKANVRRLSAKK